MRSAPDSSKDFVQSHLRRQGKTWGFSGISSRDSSTGSSPRSCFFSGCCFLCFLCARARSRVWAACGSLRCAGRTCDEVQLTSGPFSRSRFLLPNYPIALTAPRPSRKYTHDRLQTPARRGGVSGGISGERRDHDQHQCSVPQTQHRRSFPLECRVSPKCCRNAAWPPSQGRGENAANVLPKSCAGVFRGPAKPARQHSGSTSGGT